MNTTRCLVGSLLLTMDPYDYLKSYFMGHLEVSTMLQWLQVFRFSNATDVQLHMP